MEDPIEKIVREALEVRGINYLRGAPLDFYLPDYGLFIECKQFFTERVTRQLKDREDIVLVQGRVAAHAFARLLSPPKPPASSSDG